MVPPRARDEIDSPILRAALETLARRHSESYVIARTDGLALFTTKRARELLGASGRLPEPLTLRAQSILSGEDDEVCSTVLPGSRHPVSVSVMQLPNTLCHVLFVLRETQVRGASVHDLAERMGLSTRSVQLAMLASKGLKYKEIGEHLQLSEATVKTYMHALFRDVGVRSRAELGALVVRMTRES